MIAADFLSKVSLFSFMRGPELLRLSRLTRNHSFKKGDVIYKEGDPGGQLFMIVSGEVEVVLAMGSENERRVMTLGPYAYFGEMTLVDEPRRSASAVAVQDTEALSLDQSDVKQEIKEYPEMAIELLRIMSHRVRALEKNIMNALGGLFPICGSCKKIRDEKGAWTPMES